MPQGFKELYIHNRTKILLALIILLGAFLRFYRFETFDFYADSSRDILVAKHMIETEGFKNIGPGASAGWNLIRNSPFYFWMLAIFWFYFRSPLLITLVFSLFGMATILIGYFVGKFLYNEKTGITLAFFICVSNLFIRYSRSVYQPHLIPIVTIACIYLFFKSIQSKSLRWFLAYIQMVFIGLHLHYSFLPVFCICSIWMVILLIKNYTTWRISFRFIPVIFYIAQLFIWINLTYVTSPLDQMGFFGEMFQKIKSLENTTIFISRSNTIINSLFSNVIREQFFAPMFLLFMIAVSTFMGVKNALKDNNYILLFISNCLLSMILTTIYVDPSAPLALYAHYFAPYYILILALVTYLIIRYVSMIQIQVVLILVIGYLLIRGYRLPDKSSNTNYATMEKISYEIYKDHNSHQPNTLPFAVYDHKPGEEQFDYYVGQYYYFLENFMHAPLVQISTDDRNIMLINENTYTNYLVCSWFSVGSSEQDIQNLCVKPFQKQYDIIISASEPKFISRVQTDTSAFTIYRFMSTDTIPIDAQ